MRILVTGGAGFIGTNLVHHLLDIGGDVLVVDNLSTGKTENLDPRAGFRKLDIREDAFLTAVDDYAPDVVVHLAAQPSVGRSVEFPEETFDINLTGTDRVIDATLSSGASRLVFASTAAVYGNPEELPLRETSHIHPINPYGESKLAAEGLIDERLRGTDTDFCIFRFANVYGPRQDTIGEGGVVSIFCDLLASGEKPMIHGDGQQVRDFIYVADIVSALVSAIGGDIEFKQSVDCPAPGRYNISTGEPVTVEQLLNALRPYAEFYGMPQYGPPREGDIRESILSPAKARETFEWVAQVPLDRGLEATWNWFRKHS